MNEKKKIIIIEDNYEHNKRVVKYTKEAIMNHNYKNYEIVSFKNYNDKLRDIIFDNTVKIFIIDLILGVGPKALDGYEICEIIRNEAKDWHSRIIIMSIHQFQNNIISRRVDILTYILKNECFEIDVKESVLKACEIIEYNYLLSINKNIKVATSEICYIKKVKQTKYCSVVTFYGNHKTRNTLKNLKEKLHFKKINDHVIINEQNVVFISKELIVFKNNIQINLEQI